MKLIAIRVLSGVLGLAALAPSYAATIVSDEFYIAQGFVMNPDEPGNGIFNTSETSGVNVSPGSNFSLDVSVLSAALSATGFTFFDAVLGGYGTNSWTSFPNTFSVTLDASYVGPTPLDAAANPNYQLQINITSISIWAASLSPQGESRTLGWTETTLGNAQNQAPWTIETNPDPNWLYLSNYVNVGWTPNGFLSSGDSQVRTFGLAQSQATSFSIDGFQVSGNIVLTYTAIPEPGTVGLVSVAALMGFALFRLRHVQLA